MFDKKRKCNVNINVEVLPLIDTCTIDINWNVVDNNHDIQQTIKSLVAFTLSLQDRLIPLMQNAISSFSTRFPTLQNKYIAEHALYDIHRYSKMKSKRAQPDESNELVVPPLNTFDYAKG